MLKYRKGQDKLRNKHQTPHCEDEMVRSRRKGLNTQGQVDTGETHEGEGTIKHT